MAAHETEVAPSFGQEIERALSGTRNSAAVNCEP